MYAEYKFISIDDEHEHLIYTLDAISLKSLVNTLERLNIEFYDSIKNVPLGSVINFGDNRDVMSYLVGKDGKLIRTEETNDGGFLGVPKDVAALVDNAPEFYKNLAVFSITLPAKDQFLLEHFNEDVQNQLIRLEDAAGAKITLVYEHPAFAEHLQNTEMNADIESKWDSSKILHATPSAPKSLIINTLEGARAVLRWATEKDEYVKEATNTLAQLISELDLDN